MKTRLIALIAVIAVMAASCVRVRIYECSHVEETFSDSACHQLDTVPLGARA